MLDGYQIVERMPTPDEYGTIVRAVGWEPVLNFDAVPESLRRSLFGVVATYEGQVIGMGRIVGDGAMYFYIQDIAVLPEHQHRGVGHQIMQHLLAYLRANAPDKAFVGLFATENTGPFYERYGFLVRSSLTGMYQVILRVEQ